MLVRPPACLLACLLACWLVTTDSLASPRLYYLRTWRCDTDRRLLYWRRMHFARPCVYVTQRVGIPLYCWPPFYAASPSPRSRAQANPDYDLEKRCHTNWISAPGVNVAFLESPEYAEKHFWVTPPILQRWDIEYHVIEYPNVTVANWIVSIFVPRSWNRIFSMQRKKRWKRMTTVEEKKKNRTSRMCASHYGRLRTIMEIPDNARADCARRFHVIPFSVGSLFQVRIYKRCILSRPFTYTRVYSRITNARVSRFAYASIGYADASELRNL